MLPSNAFRPRFRQIFPSVAFSRDCLDAHQFRFDCKRIYNMRGMVYKLSVIAFFSPIQCGDPMWQYWICG